MLRGLLLWWRAKGCYHKTAPSIWPGTLWMPQCERCGTVFFSSGEVFGRHRESVIELGDKPGHVQSKTHST